MTRPLSEVLARAVTQLEVAGVDTPMRDARRLLAHILDADGLDVGNIVEMTSYHVGLRDHIDLFRSVRDEFVREPYPAWTAIEVAGLISEGAIVELRIIARRP